MSVNLLQRLNTALRQIELAFPMLFGGKFPPGSLALADLPVGHHNPTAAGNQSSTFGKWSLKELLGDGILWAVPRNRRTIERRWKRKFGDPEYVNKLLLPKTNLRSCTKCGSDHEVGILCPHCYENVRQETKLMQDQIQQELGLSAVDKEVVVLYEGEKGEQPQEFWNDKRVVEIARPRPSWFSKNLLQKTTQPAATTKEVKPNDLG